MTPETLFYTGSTTKSFTAAGLSLLVDNSSDYGSIRWETPISQLLRDDFVLSDDWATAVSAYLFSPVRCEGLGWWHSEYVHLHAEALQIQRTSGFMNIAPLCIHLQTTTAM